MSPQKPPTLKENLFFNPPQTNLPFLTSPPQYPIHPLISTPNSTSNEQWEFDGISSDGLSSFIFGFYRDPTFSFFGTGNLRMYAEFTFANKSRYAIVDYAEESEVITCPGIGTRGTWRNDKQFEYFFEVSEDFKYVKIGINNPEVKGLIEIESIAEARYTNSKVWGDTKGEVWTGIEYFYHFEPIPAAEVKVDVVIHGEKIQWKGLGGHERLWAAFNWFSCLEGLLVARFKVGRFAVSFLEFFKGENRKGSVVINEKGRQVFGSTEQKEGERDWFMLERVYGGKGITTEKLEDKVTGMRLKMVSPGRNTTWEFELWHRNVAFEYNLGSGRGGTGYSGLVKGGLVGEEKEEEGPAFSEVMRFPERSLLLKKNFV
ncbi:hypothetical protein QBC38DRAFT_519471 [Podospora fimiseda]|uniref:Uncharacterized protein n=1 Tax=Podospora fimiseda TaxID=252190 RepID=A0AAN6YPJ5_9PEZI|nr:hypothetical protein QBC38DRAFT_519471 [Podospora fimiseda]